MRPRQPLGLQPGLEFVEVTGAKILRPTDAVAGLRQIGEEPWKGDGMALMLDRTVKGPPGALRWRRARAQASAS
jgi:hypothetical protein